MKDDNKKAGDFNNYSYHTIAGVCPEIAASDIWAIYAYLKDEIVQSQTFDKCMDLVAQYSDFFTAPASSRFHLNKPLGLLRHSLGVTFRLLALAEAFRFMGQYPLVDMVLAGLLHDLGKAGTVTPHLMDVSAIDSKNIFQSGNNYYMLERSQYYTKRELKTKPGEFEYKRNKENIVRMSIPMGSLHFISTVLSDVWKPSPEVWAAIGYHDGQYVPEGAHVGQSETKLGLALHQADYWQGRVEVKWALSSSWRK